MWTCIYLHFPSKQPKCIWIKPYIECLGLYLFIHKLPSLQLSLGTLKKDANSRKKGKDPSGKPQKDQRKFQLATEPGQ